MDQREYNFSPGPAVLPLPVLEQAQRDLLCIPGQGCSVLEISHRSDWCIQMVEQAQANLRTLLALPANYQILFLSGGARTQFCMVPMNLLRGKKSPAEYVITGSWGKSAHQDATLEGPTRVLFDGKSTHYDRLPDISQLEINPQAAYVHVTSNETIQGVQFSSDPETGNVPLVCDASSDFLYRPLEMRRYGLLYACAQKNSGPAGVTIVIIRDDVLERCADGLHSMFDYRQHVAEKSMLNTPPVFAIYLNMLVTDWLIRSVGGLEKMLEINLRKAKLLYDVIDQSEGFYTGHARKECRSLMNVVFRLPNDELQGKFLKQAQARRLQALKGHRSVGGIRASIYNAMPMSGVEELRQHMLEFKSKHQGQNP